MKNNGYLYAKIGGILIIAFMLCSFFWSLKDYAMPSALGIFSLLIGCIAIYCLLKASHLIAALEEQNKNN